MFMFVLTLLVFLFGCESVDSDGVITDFQNLNQYTQTPKRMITIQGTVDYFPRDVDGRLMERSVMDKNGYHIFFLPYRSDQSFTVGDVLQIKGYLSKSKDGKYYILETAQPIVKK